MPAHLEFGNVPCCIFMRRSLDMTKLCLIRVNITANPERQLNYTIIQPNFLHTIGGPTLQEFVPLVPINDRIKSEHRSRL